MANKYQDFIHPSDKKALDALKALPGFDYLVKKFMSIYIRANVMTKPEDMVFKARA